jgi:hypothetical protein
MHEGLGPKSGEGSWLEWSGEREKAGKLEPKKLSDQAA